MSLTGAPSWTPSGTTDRCCQNCGGHRTKAYFRQFADEDGVLHHCSGDNCLTHRDMLSGAGRMPEYDAEKHRRRHSVSDHHPIFNGAGSDE